MNIEKYKPKERVFLIDSENISDYSFIDTYKVSIHDKVVIFISERSKSMKLAFVQKLIDSGAKISFENVSTGQQNEMDFQIVAYLGMNISNIGVGFYLVSEDSGYLSPIKYILSKNPNAEIHTINTNYPVAVTKDNHIEKEDLLNNVLEAVKVIRHKQVQSQVRKVIVDNLTSNNEEIEIKKALEKYVLRLPVSSSTRNNICNTIMDPVNKFLKENSSSNIETSIKIS